MGSIFKDSFNTTTYKYVLEKSNKPNEEKCIVSSERE